jgi:hypothetical protein
VGDPPTDLPQDTYRYTPPEAAEFEERFTLEPVDPETVAERFASGQRLVTMDVPGYLGRSLAPDADAAVSLYRLVQLFGTPNVPGLEAGADQPERHERTWQYLFELSYDPEEGDGERTFLLSVYDYRTDLSVGLSEFRPADGDGDGHLPEPSPDPLPSGEVPGEPTLEAFVQLVLSTVERAVEATYKGLHV